MTFADNGGNHLCNRWEQGSEFHFLQYTQPEAVAHYPWDGKAAYLGSGRDALGLLIRHGMEHLGWRRIYIPSYFCQEVVKAIIDTGIETLIYTDSPLETKPEIMLGQCAIPGDIILLVNFFGLRYAPNLAEHLKSKGFIVIEDHTHDPYSEWAFQSKADWCIASLRKVFPVPDGGVIWSPAGTALPKEPAQTSFHDRAVLEKFSAMVLKERYLAGAGIGKDLFRKLAIAGEKSIYAGDYSGISEITRQLLPTFPIAEWRQTRKANWKYLMSLLSTLSWVSVLRPQDESQVCPFSVIVTFENKAVRDSIREHLCHTDIYPAILWPIERGTPGVPKAHIRLSETLLSIHCDMRYSESDLTRVFEAFNKCVR